MRTHIDYGIYFNNDFCQIARMEDGMPVIKKSDTMKDAMALCVAINKRQDILVGEQAYNVLKNDKVRASKTFEKRKSNTFIGFIRTIGTNYIYESSNTCRSFTSEELLAECFKKLKTFNADEELKAVVITIPAKFLYTQSEAVKKAGLLAGFKQIELIQEPVAAAIGLGLGSKGKKGFFLVFDFQGEFKVTLCKLEDGTISIADTDGDNWLGQENITEAIIDEIIVPYLKQNYALDSILNDCNKKENLKEFVRHFAVEAKEQLNNKELHCILSNVGSFQYEDENGEELELVIEISQQDLAWVSRPIYQKAIDITIDLLKRNNKTGKDIEHLIFVGEETYSPILRNLVKEQITDKIDSSVDPMTVVAKGAALFASTIPINNLKGAPGDKTKIQLDIKHEKATIELDEFISIKVIKEKTFGTIPDKVYADVVRSDRAWSSGEKLIGEKASIIEVPLSEGQSNAFVVNAYDEAGKKLECRPNQFSILQGIGGLDGMQVLPYHIGIAKYFEAEGKELFMTIKGLEKNKNLPAIGVINGFKTKIDIRPGVASDVIRIPIYQGDYNAEGTNPVLNNLITEVIISGETFPKLLPEGSDVNITIKVDKSQIMQFTAQFPTIEHTEDLKIEIKQTEPITPKYIDKFKGELILFYSDNPSMGKDRFRFLLGELIRVENQEVVQDEKVKVVEQVKIELRKWQ